MAVTKILIGADASAPDLIFTRDNFIGLVSIVTAVDIIGSELSADELTVTVTPGYGSGALLDSNGDALLDSNGLRLRVRSASEQDLSSVAYATPVWVETDGAVRHRLFFIEASQTGPKAWKITARSGVGLLDRVTHMGGLYTGQTVATVLQEIIGSTFAYTVDPAVAIEKVYEWLPADTARKNLHKLMFALGFALTKDAAGEIVFRYLSDAISGTIPGARTFYGGTIEHQRPVSAVEVTEHSFVQTVLDEEATLFDNAGDAAVSNLTVTFDGPVHDLTAGSGLTIVSSGVNFAVISGVGTLTGKKYTHNTRIVRLENPLATEINVVTSSDDTLVNAYNARNVARRLLAYYTARQTARLTVRLLDEKAGQRVSYTSPYGGTADGYIAQAQITVGGWQKAQLRLIRGYIPTGQGNYYSHRVLITSSGTWTVPSGVDRVKLVIVGAGSGGQGGQGGEDGLGGAYASGGSLHYDRRDLPSPDGTTTYIYAHWFYSVNAGDQRKPEGGAGGIGGIGGKVYIIEQDVLEGDVLTVALGVGGSGGSAGAHRAPGGTSTGGSGSAGGDTTVSSSRFGTLSSASGESGSGYYDAQTGEIYGAPGGSGIAGGNGGMTDVAGLTGDNGRNGYPGQSVGAYTGGAGGTGAYGVVALATFYMSGGGGGGAAVGAGGGAGKAYTKSGDNWYGANGGNGASASAPAAAIYGGGGAGGNGGGAGGNGAGCTKDLDYWNYATLQAPGNGGTGGSGSVGGSGGAGVVLILY